MSRAVIISGGDISGFFNFKEDDFIICADMGYEFAVKHNIKVDALIGDFDSIGLPLPQNTEIIKFPSKKNETDTELALIYLLDRGFKDIIIIGALGGRADHSIANILLLKKALKYGANAVIRDENTKISLVSNGQYIIEDECKYVSIFPIFGDASGVNLYNMKYPLENALLSQGDIIGISNEKTHNKATVSVKCGTLLVVEVLHES